MRRASLLWIAVLLAGVLPAAAQSYRVAGTLSSSVTGAPIPHGHLSAALVAENGEANDPPVTAEADEQGRFQLALPSAGEWIVTASARGFRTAALDEHEGFSTGVVVGKATPAVQVAFRLAPNAAIAGYVLDEAGEAVRNAQVTLLRAGDLLAEPGRTETLWQARGSTRTDDRGHYEFATLAPGRFEVLVQAQPWYATSAPGFNGSGFSVPIGRTPVESPLDVAYPLTWYPGVTEASAAGILTLQGGDARQADLRLLPVPAVHLRVPFQQPEPNGRGINLPQMQMLLPSGVNGFQGPAVQFMPPDANGRGEVDIGGLVPGATYEVTNAGQTSLLRVGAGSPRALDLAAATPLVAVTVHFDAPAGVVSPQVQFVDAVTGRVVPLGGGGDRGFRGGPVPRIGNGLGFDGQPGGGDRPRGGRMQDRMQNRSAERTLDLPAGRYEVHLFGNQGQFLTGITGADAAGRFVTLSGSAAEVTLHLAAGRAVCAGVAMIDGAPAAGAMVLLIPATLGDPQSLTIVRRDQANTDGSFRIRDVLPGRYILIAIDHGWHTNWRDPATLNRYLLHGTPVDLTVPGNHAERIEAQRP